MTSDNRVPTDAGDTSPQETPTTRSVTAVVATRGRPELLRRALRSIAGQRYGGRIQIIVVFDQCPVDELADVRAEIAEADNVELKAVSNERSPGLAGGRNTGLLAAAGDLIAFCDDDDEWLADKLTKQTELLVRHQDAICASGAITIATHDATTTRTPPEVVRHRDFLASRVAEIHPSTLLFPRERAIDEVGLVDEELPFGYGEDYDFLLRLSAVGSVVSVTEPIATIHWDRTSFFASRWQGMAAGLSYVLDKHPELLVDHRNAARMTGQVAFAHAAAAGALESADDVRTERQHARHWALRSVRRRPLELRAWAALGIGIGLVPSELVIRTLNRFGRGV